MQLQIYGISAKNIALVGLIPSTFASEGVFRFMEHGLMVIVESFILPLVTVSATELADKTMLVAMCFGAEEQNNGRILLAVVSALMVSTFVAIVLGSGLRAIIPIDWLAYISGVLFILLGIHSLFFRDDDEETKCSSDAELGAMFSTVLISELGDKSQLAILGLAVNSAFPLAVFSGAVTAFIIVSVLSIGIGSKLGTFGEKSAIHKIAGAIFIAVGFLILLGILQISGTIDEISSRLSLKEENVWT
ncbi:MAG: TMEM165/GDT1 family protein [Promethearchaeia archaeon]